MSLLPLAQPQFLVPPAAARKAGLPRCSSCLAPCTEDHRPRCAAPLAICPACKALPRQALVTPSTRPPIDQLEVVCPRCGHASAIPASLARAS